MTKNFKVRLGVTLSLLIIATVFLFTFSGVPFKIFFGTFATIAGIELLSFFLKKHTPLNIILGLLELAFLVFSSIYIAKISVLNISIMIFGICGYDTFAYLFGNALGGKFTGDIRPFRYVSKNKTWEGTIMGLISSFTLVGFLMIITNSYDYILLLTGPLALVGDLLESLLKRTFTIKDSNEIVIKNHIFKKVELLVGGSEGHGGYLDRIDSFAFTATILLLSSIL